MCPQHSGVPSVVPGVTLHKVEQKPVDRGPWLFPLCPLVLGAGPGTWQALSDCVVWPRTLPQAVRSVGEAPRPMCPLQAPPWSLAPDR